MTWTNALLGILSVVGLCLSPYVLLIGLGLLVQACLRFKP